MARMTHSDRKLYNALGDWLSDWNLQGYESPNLALEDGLELLHSWGTVWVEDEEQDRRRGG